MYHFQWCHIHFLFIEMMCFHMKKIEMGYYDIAENTELLEYLKEKYKQGKIDILLHGYSHEYQLNQKKWVLK